MTTGGPDRAAGYTPQPDGGQSPLDELLDALGHSTRRRVLSHLRGHGVATLDELAAEIAAWEMGAPPDEVPAARRERAASTLAHTHLPKLARSGCIEYDARSQTARYDDPSALVDLLVLLLAKFDDEPGT